MAIKTPSERLATMKREKRREAFWFWGNLVLAGLCMLGLCAVVGSVLYSVGGR